MSARTRPGRMKGMKGQFFIVGSLFICVILFFGTGLRFGISETGTADMNQLGTNLQNEMPYALNIGINESDPAGTLAGFTIFSINAIEQRRINVSLYWVVFEPLDGMVNVSVGNFMDSQKTFSIGVNGVEKDIGVEPGSVSSDTFPVTGVVYDAGIQLPGESASLTLLFNKTSMYGSLELFRADNAVRKVIIA